MIYLALAGLSFVLALNTVANISGKMSWNIRAFEISGFFNYLNGALLGGDNVSFNVFLPEGLCNATISNGGVDTVYGTFYLAGALHIPRSALCPDGLLASLQVLYNKTGAYLLRNKQD